MRNSAMLPIERSVQLPAVVARFRSVIADPLIGVALALSAVLAALTAAVALDPSLPFVTVDGRLDAVINTLGTVLAGFVAAVAWIRFRMTNRGATLLQGLALLVFFLAGLFTMGIQLAGFERALGFTLGDAGQVPAYREFGARLGFAFLLLASGVALVRGWAPRRAEPVRLLALTVGGALAYLAVITFVGDRLPALLEVGAVGALEDQPGSAVFAGVHPVARLLAVAMAACLLGAAVTYLRVSHECGDRAVGVLGLGLVIAAAGQVHFGLFPGVHTGVVVTEDALRLGFIGTLLATLLVQQHADLRALIASNLALARFRDLDVQLARSDERARLARDLHDGLAQRLWEARLRHGRLVERTQADPEVSRLALETDDALAAAIAEARLALDVTREAAGPWSIAALVDTELDHFSRRTGVQTAIFGPVRTGTLPDRLRPDLTSVLREALSNVERHADATVVRVKLRWTSGHVVFEVFDNGRGFDADRRSPGRYGILGMEERAAVLGGRLEIDTAPGAGTHVRLVVPVEAAA